MHRLIFLAMLLMDAAGGEAGGNAGSGAGVGSGSQNSGNGSSSVTPTSTSGQGSNSQNTPSGTNNGTQNNGSQQQPDPNESDPAYGNWKALRDQANTYRTRATELENQNQTWTQVQTRASTLATTLGYTAEDFQAAFKADPMKTLAVLAQEEANRQGRHGQEGDRNNQNGNQNGTPDINRQIKDMVEQATKPANEFVNRQISEAAMAKYETSLTEHIGADPILKNAPPEVHSIVKEYLGEFFSTQPDILLGFKQKGDFTPVKEAVTYIAGRLQGAFTAWLKANNQTGGFQQNTGTGQQGAGRPNGAAKVTLDDIINDPSVLGSQYKG
jgi:hypothetical protein